MTLPEVMNYTVSLRQSALAVFHGNGFRGLSPSTLHYTVRRTVWVKQTDGE